MAVLTSQQLAHYYDTYTTIDVTFTKPVAQATGLQSQDVFLRCLGQQLPCIVYSSSMVGAKVIASLSQAQFERLREAKNLVALRFCIKDPDKPHPLSFFVAARVTGYNPYGNQHKDLNLLVLAYTQRPSDDLIAVLGQLLQANINSKKRREKRIAIDPESIRKLGLDSREATLQVKNATRTCIVRDLSFSGASILMTGYTADLNEKEVALVIAVDGGKSNHKLVGKIVRFDEIPEQKGIGSAVIHFDEPRVGMKYRMRLNEYLTTLRKT